MTGTDFQIVKTPSVFKIDDSFNDDRFCRVRIAVMHSGENLNHSSFSTDVIRKAKDTFSDIPVLANVIRYTDENGEEHLDYGGHDAHIEEDAFNEGKYRLIYDEKVVGHVPTKCNFEIIHDDESDKDYAYVDAYLYRSYANYCCDILEARGGKTDVSAEVYTDTVSFDAAKNVIVVEAMRMAAITLLGEDVHPAMKGANASVFSIDKDDLQAQMIKVMSDLAKSLETYTAALGETSREGGNKERMKFEELLEKYGKTAEEIEFEYDGLTDEELEAAFAEAFTDEATPDDNEGEEDPEEEEKDFAKMYVNIDGAVREFSVSLKDKINALYSLVNETYADDGTWYDVDVFDDEKYIIMVDMCSGKGYKQSYKVKKDVYTLVGDRVEVYATWLTQDEINKIDKMKAEYSEMSEKLSHYEEEPKKLEILNSEDYSLVADSEEFTELRKQENHFNLSVEEVTAKADAILTEAAKKHKFSVQPENTNPIKPLPQNTKKAKRFGSLFDGII